jgi:hypothetical protein
VTYEVLTKIARALGVEVAELVEKELKMIYTRKSS